MLIICFTWIFWRENTLRILMAFFLLICISAAASSPASAAVPMSEKLCTLSTPVDSAIEAVLSIADKFNCGDSKYTVSGPRIWIKIPFDAATIADGTVEVQGNNNGLTTMEVHSRLYDGSILSSRFSERETARNWRSIDSYGLSIPGSDSPEIRSKIEEVYIAIDNPKVIGSILRTQLVSKQYWDDLTLKTSMMFGILCGMMIMPLFYNVFFYGALRYNFMPWHSLMIAGGVMYTFSTSGLILLAFPETSLTTKFLLNHWSLAIAIAGSGFFLVRFIEPGKIAPWLKSMILVSALLPTIVLSLIFLIGGGFSIDAPNYYHYYHAAFLPHLAILVYTMGHAFRRGSKAIWFHIAAWVPITLFGLDRIARGMDLYIGIPALDYGLYFIMVFETLILALGVAFRIMQLRYQHENSLREQVELKLLAGTDGLTSLANRRAFEKEFADNQIDRRYSTLALLDIDYFKRVNDQYSHEVGDEVLRIVGRELADTQHFSARIGGEEFILLMHPEARENRKANATAQLTEVCEKLIQAIHKGIPEIEQPVTFSVGVAKIAKRTSLKMTMATADRRLYDAKNNGRNQIVSFDISPKQLERRENRASAKK